MKKSLHQGQGEKLNSDFQPIKKCHVCNQPSRPWCYILHGNAHVCSKDCHDRYNAMRGVK